MNDNNILVSVENLTKHFPITKGIIIQRKVGAIQAVDDVSFFIRKGETLGLVGESGCGKSTVGRTILQLYKPTSGKVYVHDKELTSLSGEDLRRERRGFQMIFQDPYASLNPRMTIGRIIAEPMLVHKIGNSKERLEKVHELLRLVGMASYFVNRYPHEFSGGQRQRVGIARALALQPEFIILDEPISALDVSIQAQVINLLEELQKMFGLTYLFIAHDLSMVRRISDRVAVMYLGKIVESSPSKVLYSNPLHPYTQALLSAVPFPDPKKERKRQRIILVGEVPSPANPPKGCRFHTRCPIARDECKQAVPIWREVQPDHWVACHLV